MNQQSNLFAQASRITAYIVAFHDVLFLVLSLHVLKVLIGWVVYYLRVVVEEDSSVAIGKQIPHSVLGGIVDPFFDINFLIGIDVVHWVVLLYSHLLHGLVYKLVLFSLLYDAFVGFHG